MYGRIATAGRGITVIFLALMSLQSAVAAPAEGAEPVDPTATTAEDARPDAVAAEGSPWEHELWSGATTMMRIYVCAHARRQPSWCEEEQQLPSKAPLPAEHGPPLTAEDAAWLHFLERTDPSRLTAQDVAVIKRRASERRDPQAMEILGFLYAQGGPVQRDYAESYRWYGRAYLAGERRVRANMDIVWGLLQRHDIEAALALTREFNALTSGRQVPDPGAPDKGSASGGAADTSAYAADPTGQ